MTTLAPVRKIDPISGREVVVSEIASCGSYIYDWPSKYDLAFWSLTDEEWICFCPESGYASFCDDFDQLSDKEKEHVSQWLKRNYDPLEKPENHEEKLTWLENVYGQRDKDDDFWCRFYRLMAYAHAED